MPALPTSLRKAIRINWQMTLWCNYHCEYCPAAVFRQRSKSRQRQPHAFDHHSASEWLDAFRRFEYDDIYVNISGGEPFLDRKNLRDLLAGLLERPNVHPLLNTNGCWDADYFGGLDTSRIAIVMSYHASQVGFEEYFANVRRIRNRGFRIAAINLVLAPENIDRFEAAFHALEDDGFFVSVSPMVSAGVYWSRGTRSERELDLIERYNLPVDNYFVIVNPPTKGRLCFYPAMSYSLWPDGRVQIACRDSVVQDLFTQGIPPIPREATPCEYEHCAGCGDMCRSLVDAPFASGRLDFFEKDACQSWVDETRAYRARYEIEAQRKAWPFGLDRVLRRGNEIPSVRAMAKKAAASSRTPVVSMGPALAPLPEQPIFGHSDQARIIARGGDRISVSGWAASRDQGAPLREVRMILDGREIGVFRDFSERPDVAATYGRADLLRCGWRGMLNLPALSNGDHNLVPEAYDAQGNLSVLPALIVTIAD
jgi:MoaA/NifB/PqqE/SkfB family radical SAM enzyme